MSPSTSLKAVIVVIVACFMCSRVDKNRATPANLPNGRCQHHLAGKSEKVCYSEIRASGGLRIPVKCTFSYKRNYTISSCTCTAAVTTRSVSASRPLFMGAWPTSHVIECGSWFPELRYGGYIITLQKVDLCSVICALHCWQLDLKIYTMLQIRGNWRRALCRILGHGIIAGFPPHPPPPRLMFITFPPGFL